MDADQRVGDHGRPLVAGSRAGLRGDQLREHVGVAGEDLLLAREQGPAAQARGYARAYLM